MVSIFKVMPLYILVSCRKKLSPHSFGEPIVKRALCILFCRGDSVFLIGCSCGVWYRGLTHNRIAWIRQLYNTLVSALGIPIMARFEIYSERMHFVVISHEYKIFKWVSNVAIMSLSCSWRRHVVVSDTCFWSARHIVTHISSSLFHIGSFLCVQSYLFVIYQ